MQTTTTDSSFTTTKLRQGNQRDLVFFLYNCISGSTNLNIDGFVTFVSHDRSRTQNPNLVLKPASCRTTTVQASFSNRIVKPWNTTCNLASLDKFSSLSIFKNILRATLLDTTFDIDVPCTGMVPLWSVPPFVILVFSLVFLL